MICLWYGAKRQYTEKSTNIACIVKIYVYASEQSERARKFWHFYILKVLFLSIFCRYFRYFVGTNDMFWAFLHDTKSAISVNILSGTNDNNAYGMAIYKR